MIYAYFPIIAAMVYGLSFAFAEKALKITNTSTYMLFCCLSGLITVMAFMAVKREGLSFTFLNNKQDLMAMIFAVATPWIGWLFTVYAIKNTSAAYAAFAEISYPLFTVLCLILFFGVRQFDWHVLLGGAFILLGSFILVWGQSAKAP